MAQILAGVLRCLRVTVISFAIVRLVNPNSVPAVVSDFTNSALGQL